MENHMLFVPCNDIRNYRKLCGSIGNHHSQLRFFCPWLSGYYKILKRPREQSSCLYSGSEVRCSSRTWYGGDWCAPCPINIISHFAARTFNLKVFANTAKDQGYSLCQRKRQYTVECYLPIASIAIHTIPAFSEADFFYY